jgi:hypothetical protein
MKEYREIIKTQPIFEKHEIENWTPLEILEAERIYSELNLVLESQGIEGIANLDENFLTRLIGGAAGFIIGPTVGKVIAKALGVERGILYDMFTSRLVGAALGAALTKSLGKS